MADAIRELAEDPPADEVLAIDESLIDIVESWLASRFDIAALPRCRGGR